MAVFELTSDNFVPLHETTFGSLGITERGDLQRLLRDQIDIICPDAIVIYEEFGDWEESRRRVDLLCLDKDANIVVVELKRTEDGGHMELQALRYAAMVSTMTFENAVETFGKYLAKRNLDGDPKAIIMEFLEWSEVDEEKFANDVRIVLASAEFSKELTTLVMWLNERDLDITCMRLKPYKDGERVLIDVQQIIPLVEAEDYRIRLKEKKERQRESKRTSRDLTKFDLVVGDESFSRLSKRQAILRVVKKLCDSGVGVSAIEACIDWRKSLFKAADGKLNSASFVQCIIEREGRFDATRYSCSDEDLIVSGTQTFALTNQWGPRTRTAITKLLEDFPQEDVSFSIHGKQKWDKGTFLGQLEIKRGAGHSQLAGDLISWSEQNDTHIWWGEGGTYATLMVILKRNGQSYHLFRLDDKGNVEIWLNNLIKKKPFADLTDELLRRLNTLPSIDCTQDQLASRPKFELGLLENEEAMNCFKGFCDWMIEAVASLESVNR